MQTRLTRMCIGMRIGICIGMCLDMYVVSTIGMCIDICGDMCTSVGPRGLGTRGARAGPPPACVRVCGRVRACVRACTSVCVHVRSRACVRLHDVLGTLAVGGADLRVVYIALAYGAWSCV